VGAGASSPAGGAPSNPFRAACGIVAILAAMPWSVRLARAFWPRWYRFLARLDPVIERAWRRRGIGNVVRVSVAGRRTGLERTMFLGLLRVGARRYLGHPDVACAWTLNLEAAGGGQLELRDGRRVRFEAVLVEPGPEREAVIRATFHQHPFPGNVAYWLLRANLRASGRFYRLSGSEPQPPGAAGDGNATVTGARAPVASPDQVPWP